MVWIVSLCHVNVFLNEPSEALGVPLQHGAVVVDLVRRSLLHDCDLGLNFTLQSWMSVWLGYSVVTCGS